MLHYLKPNNSNKDISNIVRRSYINYAIFVILNRSLPDVNDGFKPVQRKILYAMFCEKIFSNKPYEKCAGVVGEVLKNYHPHGDLSIYDSLVRLGQNWSLKYTYIDAQGNFGSPDGDSPAAYRYTECRLSKLSSFLFENIKENVGGFSLNYRQNLLEPKILPTLLPNILLNGTLGIAVGLISSIPSHNINEVFNAILVYIITGSLKQNLFIKLIPGPDFQLKSILKSWSKFNYLTSGKGIVTYLGSYLIKRNGRGWKFTLVLNFNFFKKKRIFEKLNFFLKNNESLIIDCIDESDDTIKFTLILLKNYLPWNFRNEFFYSINKSNASVSCIALFKEKPKLLSFLKIIKIYFFNIKLIFLKKYIFRVENLKKNISLLKGVFIFLNNVNDFIKNVRSFGVNFLRKKNKCVYKWTRDQSNYIYSLKLNQIYFKNKYIFIGNFIKKKLLIFEKKLILFNSKILKKSILNKINFIKTTSDSTRASLIIRYSDKKIPTLSLEGRYYLVCFYNYRITSSRIQKLNFFKSKIYYSNFNNRYISKIQLVRLNLNYIVFRNSGEYIIIQNKDLLEFNFKNFISIFKIKYKDLNLYFLFTKLGFIQKKLILNFQKNFQKDNKLKLSGEDLIIKVVQYRNNIGCVVQTDLNECVCIDLKLLQNYTNLKLKNFLKKKLKPKSNIINMQIIYIDKRYNIIDDYGFFFTINLKNLNQFQNKLKKSRQKIILMKKFSYKLILIIFLNKLKVYQTTIHKINKKSHRKKILPLLNGQKKNFLVKIIQLWN